MLEHKMPPNFACKRNVIVRRLKGTLAVLCLAGLIHSAFAADSEVKSVTSFHGRARITFLDDRNFDAVAEQGQLAIDDIKIAPDHKTVGWLVLYANPDSPGLDPLAGKLVIWRDGRLLRRFNTDQVFYSWSFFRDGDRVGYHTGPTHGERVSHCELHNVADGSVVEKWDGDLDADTQRPEWVISLKR